MTETYGRTMTVKEKEEIDMSHRNKRERERSILSLQRALGLEYGRLGLMKLSNMKLLMSICEISRPWAKQAWSQKKRHTHTQAFDLLYFIRFLPAKELVMSLVLA